MQPSSQPSPTASLGVCYYPEHWAPERWTADFDAMCDIGIRFVRVGEFAWSRLEPNSGEYRFEWMREVLDLAAQRQLSIVLCTPTAAPPKWLVDQMPDMVAIDANGLPRRFGSRRHYCFSHIAYRRACERIVTKLAQSFGEHPAIAAWQTDNEYGCHNTILSYSTSALLGFREWLKSKYLSIDQLNRAWGNVFWSMEFRDFNEIELTNLTVTQPNPSHQLDFMRFSSDQVKSFNRLQVEIIRKYSPGKTIRRLGLNVDVVSQETSLDPYRVVAIPSLPIVEPGLVESLKRFQGQVLIGPRTGSKTTDFQIPQELPPGPLKELIPITVQRVESLPYFAPISLNWNSTLYQCHLWLERVRTDLMPFIRLPDGQGVAYRHRKISYLTSMPDQALLDAIIEQLARSENLNVAALPDGVRSRARGRLRFFFNYGPEPVTLHLPPETRFCLGGPELPIAGVAAIEQDE